MTGTVRVYLVRHAKAEEAAPAGGGDAARRLTPEGRRRFQALAAGLAGRLGLRRILTSPFVRALETADLLAGATGAPVEEEPALASSDSSGREILALLRRAGAGAAAVGHNPEIAEAVALAAGGEEKVKPGTVAAVDLLPDGRARLAWLQAPEK